MCLAQDSPVHCTEAPSAVHCTQWLTLCCLLQDLTVHRTEIHSKLVAIMRERLATNLKQLPAVADMWGHQPQGEQELAGPPAPSHFALTNSKQLRILSQVGCTVMVLYGLDGKQLICLQAPIPRGSCTSSARWLLCITGIGCIRLLQLCCPRHCGCSHWVSCTTAEWPLGLSSSSYTFSV